MSAAHDDGGTAFPVSDAQSASPGTSDELKAMARGMSLRDYFAAKVLQGFIGNTDALIEVYKLNKGREALAVANVAYEMADAMLKARAL